jgi:hypothetical protein
LARRPRAAAKASAPTTPDPVEIEAARMDLSAADRAEVVRRLGVRPG